jgi:hypothetical protein
VLVHALEQFHVAEWQRRPQVPPIGELREREHLLEDLPPLAGLPHGPR